MFYYLSIERMDPYNMENEIRPPTQSPIASLPAALLMQRGLVLVIILVVALIGFEMFNYSTTDYALSDLLGDMRFAGVRWSTILALAFCGIDFAGIARMFTPEEEMEHGGKEAWYLFGAWLLAATLNALLTWWGVAMALANREMMSTSIVDQSILSHAVPVFVACVVWVTRILLISNLTTSSMRLFQQPEQRRSAQRGRAVVQYDHRPEPRRAATPAPARPTASHREQPAQRPATAAARPSQTQSRPQPALRPSNPTPQPAAPRPAATNRPRPAPQPAPKPARQQPDLPDENENLPPEPEYIPDPGFSAYRPGYHSLSARANNNGNGERRM